MPGAVFHAGGQAVDQAVPDPQGRLPCSRGVCFSIVQPLCGPRRDRLGNLPGGGELMGDRR